MLIGQQFNKSHYRHIDGPLLQILEPTIYIGLLHDIVCLENILSNGKLFLTFRKIEWHDFRLICHISTILLDQVLQRGEPFGHATLHAPNTPFKRHIFVNLIGKHSGKHECPK